jgi:hypothetical protein
MQDVKAIADLGPVLSGRVERRTHLYDTKLSNAGPRLRDDVRAIAESRLVRIRADEYLVDCIMSGPRLNGYAPAS